MATASIYISKEYQERWDAIVNKREWIEQHLDTDIQREEVIVNSKTPNVPRPDFVSVFLWNTWLRDNGFEVEV